MIELHINMTSEKGSGMKFITRVKNIEVHTVLVKATVKSCDQHKYIFERLKTTIMFIQKQYILNKLPLVDFTRGK